MKSLPKTCDAIKGMPAGRKQSRSSFRLSGQGHRASLQESKPDRSWPGKQTFIEDFTGEHSLPGLQVSSIGISGSF